MTSRRHLNLMALMREIEEPSKVYNRSVRQASAAFTDSPEWDRAVGRGNAALDEVEKAVRAWVAKHPESSTMPDGFEQKACVTVGCAVCGYRYDEAEFVMHFPSIAEASGHTVGDGWDELKDSRVLCMRGDEKHDELRASIGVVDPV
ncbi:hypothetical protein [Streptomyces sp. NPDC096324]|uniref:hypothetical protein n=1 Tax=Streptomyces sp. NPDC096324 TaxID=3366085 RepID=UPI003826794F